MYSFFIGKIIYSRVRSSLSVYRLLTDADVQWVRARVRQRVLRWFVRQGYLDKDDAKERGQWHNGGGFSVDALVRIGADNRAGFERLLRYCARPPLALERLEAICAQRLLSRPPNSGHCR